MKTKQLIERNLKFSDKYTYLGITRGSIESGQLTSCDNCGKLITNMVQIGRNNDKKMFTIGTDCCETLVKAECMYNNGTATDYRMDIYGYNKCARVATEVRKGKEYHDELIWLVITSDKGKRIDCSKSDFVKYFPELLK